MSTAGPNTVGLLTEPYLHEWHVRAIERLLEETGMEVSLVVYNAHNDDREVESWNSRDRIGVDDIVQFFDVLGRERAWTFVLAERTLARLAGDDAALWHRHAVEDVAALSEATHVRCAPRIEDGWAEFPDDVVRQVADQCDVVIRFGFGLIRGAILDAPEDGVLSFHPADIRRYRGMGPPPIFHDGRAVAGSTLQRLDDSIDGGEIVAYDEVSLTDCETLWDVFDRIVTLQIELLTTGVENVREPTVEPTAVPDEQLGEFYPRSQRRTPQFAGRILLKNVTGRLRRRLRSALGVPGRTDVSSGGDGDGGGVESP